MFCGMRTAVSSCQPPFVRWVCVEATIVIYLKLTHHYEEYTLNENKTGIGLTCRKNLEFTT